MQALIEGIKQFPFQRTIPIAIFLPIALAALASAFFVLSSVPMPRGDSANYLVRLELLPSIVLIAVSHAPLKWRFLFVAVLLLLFKYLIGGLVVFHMLFVCEVLNHCGLIHI